MHLSYYVLNWKEKLKKYDLMIPIFIFLTNHEILHHGNTFKFFKQEASIMKFNYNHEKLFRIKQEWNLCDNSKDLQ